MREDCKKKAKIGIIGAMSIEIDLIVAGMKVEEILEVASIKFYCGEYGGTVCVVAQCGVGKVNAAVCAQAMILLFSPQLVINVGVAGGIAREVQIGDLVIASSCVQYDFDTSAFGDPKGEIVIGKKKMVYIPCDGRMTQVFKTEARELYDHVHTGVIVTGDSFVADGERCRQLSRDYQGIACEMEGGSIAQVCSMNNTAVIVIRAVSDNADHSGEVDFSKFARQAAEKSQQLIKMALIKIHQD